MIHYTWKEMATEQTFASSEVSLCLLKTCQPNFSKPPPLFVDILTNTNGERQTQNGTQTNWGETQWISWDINKLITDVEPIIDACDIKNKNSNPRVSFFKYSTYTNGWWGKIKLKKFCACTFVSAHPLCLFFIMNFFLKSGNTVISLLLVLCTMASKGKWVAML